MAPDSLVDSGMFASLTRSPLSGILSILVVLIWSFLCRFGKMLLRGLYNQLSNAFVRQQALVRHSVDKAVARLRCVFDFVHRCSTCWIQYGILVA